jgi:ribosomal protein S18 acetylase RimI-like enzyme
MSHEQRPQIVIDRLQIRSYQSQDQSSVSRLYTEGLLAGQIAPNDTGADIENVEQAYFDDERHHFWIAEVDGQVLAMIGVASDEEHTAEIRRLRVDPQYQHTDIATKLLETAIAHCKHHGFLKVRLDTRCSTQSAAVNLFDKIGFQHTRTKALHGKDLLEFYLDLYRPPRREREDSTP